MIRFHSRLPAAALVVAAVAVSPAAAQYTWTAGGFSMPPFDSVSWNNPYNWSGLTVPFAGAFTTLTFGSSASSTSIQNVANLNPPNQFLLNQMIFSAGANPYSLAGNPIEIRSVPNGAEGAIVQNSNAPIQIANNLVLDDANCAVYGSGNGTVSLTGNISGPGTLTLGVFLVNTPSPTLILSGANTYAGGTSISTGTLRLGTGSAIPTGTDIYMVFPGATFAIGTLSNTSSTAIGTYYAGPNTQFLIGSGSVGDYYLNSLQLNGGAVTDGGLSSNFWFHLRSANGITTLGSSVVATIGLAGNSRIQNDTNAPTNISVESGSTVSGIDLDISAMMSSAGLNANFTKTGAGQLRLTNPNNSANFAISQGSLRVDDMANLGSGQITLSGGTLQFNGPNQSSAKAFVLSAPSTINVVDPAATLTLTAALTGGSGLTKVGPGTLTIGNLFSAIGPVTVNGGTLNMGTPGVGDVSLLSGVYVVAYAGQSMGNLSGAAGATLDGGGGFFIGGNLSTTFAGSIIGGNGVVKGASGTLTNTLTLTGVNTFSGPLTVGIIFPGGTVALGVSGTLPSTVPVQLTNGTLALISGSTSYNQTIGSLAGGSSSLVNLGSAVLTVGTTNASTEYDGAITGSGSVVKIGSGTLTLTGISNYSGGAVVNAGTLAVTTDAALGAGAVPVIVNPFGTLRFAASALTLRPFTLNSGTLAVAAGQTLTFLNATVAGGFLTGAFATTSDGGTAFAGGSTVTSASLTLLGADSLTNFSQGGMLTIAANRTIALTRVTNTSSGQMTINGAANVSDFVSNGLVNVSATGLLTNTGVTDLTFGGGSRTFIGTVGGNGQAHLELNGQNADVAGGLFVNNGKVTDNSAAGVSTIIADYGALVKGAGVYDNSPVTRNGGKFQSGNSPGVATMGRFVFGPGGVSNYVFAIDDATGQAGPTPDALGHVSGWGLVKVAQWQRTAGMTSGDFVWTADASNPLTVAIDTLVNPTTVGIDVPGLMADFDPTRSYSWRAVQWTGTYSGPMDVAALDAATNFDTSGIVNPIDGTFGWSLSVAQVLNLSYTPSAVPEPGSLALLFVALFPPTIRRGLKRRR